MTLVERPDWLTVSAPSGEELERMKQLLDERGLHTVCESAQCPNIGECFANRTCTFMILGSICTRNCRFCDVEHGKPEPVNCNEPLAIAEMARQLNLKHVVVTTVTRDDMPDGGAAHFAATISAIRSKVNGSTIEVLISDLDGSVDSLYKILQAKPDIVGHNVETIPRLYGAVRPQASYPRSIALLNRVGQWGQGIFSKSGMMLGLGETFEEIIEVLQDLRRTGCRMVTLGQYLSPSPGHIPVERYVSPREFKELEQAALGMGFPSVVAGPLVRSSYHAAAALNGVTEKTRRR
jgi:lipoyl synthase